MTITAAGTSGRPALVRWWWVRHARVAGPAGCILGQLDPPAIFAGQERRLSALKRLLPKNAHWVTSALRRTRDSAAAILAASHSWQPGSVEPGLNEQHFGEWQGLTHEQVAELRAAEWKRVWAAPEREAPAGGESFATVVRRVDLAIDRISAAADAEDVVVVAHAGTVRAALALALDLKLERALAFVIDPLSLTRIDRIISAVGVFEYRIECVNLDPALAAPHAVAPQGG